MAPRSSSLGSGTPSRPGRLEADRQPQGLKSALLKIARPAAKKSRISLRAFAEAEAASEELVCEVLWAKMGERATNQLGDHAEYFMRWLKYDFAPGARKGWRGERPKAAAR